MDHYSNLQTLGAWYLIQEAEAETMALAAVANYERVRALRMACDVGRAAMNGCKLHDLRAYQSAGKKGTTWNTYSKSATASETL